MAQIINDPYSGNIFGRIGRGIGQGLSEQLPKEIERTRLSSGLKSLRQKAEGGAQPLDVLETAYTTPGLTPEIIQSYLPHLRTLALQQQRQAKKAQVPVQGGQQNIQQQVSDESEVQPMSPKADRIINTPEGIRDLALKIGEEEFLEFPTYQEQLAEARNRAANEQNIDARVRERVQNELQRKLQKLQLEDTFKDVLGTIQSDVLDDAVNEALLGKKSEAQIAKDVSEDLYNFARAHTDLNSLSGRDFFDKATSYGKTVDSLKNIRKEYAKYGRLNEFRDEIMSKFNLSPMSASEIAYPLERHKELSSYVSSIPKAINTDGTRNKRAKDIDSLAQEIGDKLKGTDSLWTIAGILENKGYKANNFISALSRLNREKKIELTPRQEEELRKKQNFFPTMGDFLYRWSK